VRLAEQRLADQRHRDARLGGRNGRAQPRPARADHEYVVVEPLMTHAPSATQLLALFQLDAALRAGWASGWDAPLARGPRAPRGPAWRRPPARRTRARHLRARSAGHPTPDAHPAVSHRVGTALEDSQVGPDAHRAEAHVEIGERDDDQAAPGDRHVAPVETA